MRKWLNMFTSDLVCLLKGGAFAVFLFVALVGCAPTEKLYKQTISDHIITSYENSLVSPDIVFNELKVERVYTAGDIREIIKEERGLERKDIPIDVIGRLAGFPKNRQEWVYEGEGLTEDEVYLPCQIQMKGIRNGKKMMRVIQCAYILSFEDTPFFAGFNTYYYLSVDGKTCYGSQLISRW
ncbi:MAG: hypothetical protein LUG96_14140 [Tannerellaceae bacterium]|nr:hypothetical protein [Tannerellaceae bacterium]